ncbi:unnamed protein product [Allacma fusca]|uniref:Uncharacterized protein n=1 Tax=Allacma fusca TaxID=39272 RepID=A0A8J2LY79_9HEXA|nr:unnamed protein product [Allacma fusca]
MSSPRKIGWNLFQAVGSEEEFLKPIGATQGQPSKSQIACGPKFLELEGSKSSGKPTNRNTLLAPKSTLLPENFNLFAEFYKLVLTELTSIEEDIASIKKLQLSSQQAIDNFDDIPSLPIQSQDDFNSLETWLQCSDNRTKLKLRPADFGALGYRWSVSVGERRTRLRI